MLVLSLAVLLASVVLGIFGLIIAKMLKAAARDHGNLILSAAHVTANATLKAGTAQSALNEIALRQNQLMHELAALTGFPVSEMPLLIELYHGLLKMGDDRIRPLLPDGVDLDRVKKVVDAAKQATEPVDLRDANKDPEGFIEHLGTPPGPVPTEVAHKAPAATDVPDGTRITEQIPTGAVTAAAIAPTATMPPTAPSMLALTAAPVAPLRGAMIVGQDETPPANALPVPALTVPTGEHPVVTSPERAGRLGQLFSWRKPAKDAAPQEGETPEPVVVPTTATHPPGEPGDPDPKPQPQPESPVRLVQEPPADADEPRHHDDGPSDEPTRAHEKLTTLGSYLKAEFQPDQAGYCMIVRIGLNELKDSGVLPDDIRGLLTEKMIRQLYRTIDAHEQQLLSDEVLDWLHKAGVIDNETYRDILANPNAAEHLQGIGAEVELAKSGV